MTVGWYGKGLGLRLKPLLEGSSSTGIGSGGYQETSEKQGPKKKIIAGK
jgi:hypothetical protein